MNLDFKSNYWSTSAVISLIGATAVGVWYSASCLNGINYKLERNHDELAILQNSVEVLSKSEADVERIKSDRWNYLMMRTYVRELHEQNPTMTVPDVVRIHDDLDPSH